MYRVLLVGGPDVDSRLDLMQAMRNEFTIAAAGSSPDISPCFAGAGFDYYYYPLGRGFNPLQDLCTLTKIWRLIRQFRPHIVHTFDTKPCVWGRLAARMARVPVIIGTIPGLGSLYVEDTVLSRVLQRIYHPLQRLASDGSSLTIFQNPDDARFFINAGIVRESRATVILGSGVNTEFYSTAKVEEADQERVRTDLGIGPGELVVTMISRLLRSKGVCEYAEAARLVLNRFAGIHFLLIGSIDEDSYESLSSDELRHLQNTVTLLGRRKDVPVLLSLSDIFVLPSYREGIPRVLLEAASMRLPLIATDVPGCREVVQQDVNGYLVPPKDSHSLSQAIIALIEDPELRVRFGRSSRRIVEERFSLDIVLSRTRSVYRSLMESHDPRLERNR